MSITKSAALQKLSRCLGRKLTGEPVPLANLEVTQTIPLYRTACLWNPGAGTDYPSLYPTERSLTLQIQAGLTNGLRIDWARFTQASRIPGVPKYHDNGDRIVRQVGPVEFAVATVRAGDLELAS